MSSIEIDPSLPHYDVRVFLHSCKPGAEADQRIAKLLVLPPDSYSTDLNAVVRELNKTGWWWHISHLDAAVIPTTPLAGTEGLVNNGTNYDDDGSPISYQEIFASTHPALSLSKAWIKALYDLPDAFFVQASAIPAKSEAK